MPFFINHLFLISILIIYWMSFNPYSFVPQFDNWQAFGVEFPPREENSVPLFTPPQSQPIVHHASAYDDAAIQASLQSDASGLRYYLKNIIYRYSWFLKSTSMKTRVKRWNYFPSFERNVFFLLIFFEQNVKRCISRWTTLQKWL